MKLFKSKTSGYITIWYGSIMQQYAYYSKKEAIKKFKEEHGLRGKVIEVDYCPYIFG